MPKIAQLSFSARFIFAEWTYAWSAPDIARMAYRFYVKRFVVIAVIVFGGLSVAIDAGH